MQVYVILLEKMTDAATRAIFIEIPVSVILSYDKNEDLANIQPSQHACLVSIFMQSPNSMPQWMGAATRATNDLVNLHVSTISRLLVMSVITSGIPNYLRYIKTHKLIISIIFER